MSKSEKAAAVVPPEKPPPLQVSVSNTGNGLADIPDQKDQP